MSNKINKIFQFKGMVLKENLGLPNKYLESANSPRARTCGTPGKASNHLSIGH